MEELIRPFHHHNVAGAVVRVLDDEILSVNEFLTEEYRLDAEDEYEFAYTCCYLMHRGRHVLVDAGFDPDTTPGALESLDVAPEEIDLVLLTHGDRDHVAGLLTADGTWTYPRAQHVISRELWEYLSQPGTLEAMDPERAGFYRRLLRSFKGRIRLCERESEVSDGIVFIPSPGHRVGHALFQFDTDGTPLLHTGDSFLHALFAEHPDWENVTDSDPAAGAESRKALVARASKSEALILSSHLPFPGIGRLRRLDALQYEWIGDPADV